MRMYSFCIYGVYWDITDVRTRLRINDLFAEISPEEFEDDYELIDTICKNSKYLVYISDNDGNVYIGRNFQDIQDDETGAQFKKTVVDEFNRFFDLEHKNIRFSTFNDYVSN